MSLLNYLFYYSFLHLLILVPISAQSQFITTFDSYELKYSKDGGIRYGLLYFKVITKRDTGLQVLFKYKKEFDEYRTRKVLKKELISDHFPIWLVTIDNDTIKGSIDCHYIYRSSYRRKRIKLKEGDELIFAISFNALCLGSHSTITASSPQIKVVFLKEILVRYPKELNLNQDSRDATIEYITEKINLSPASGDPPP